MNAIAAPHGPRDLPTPPDPPAPIGIIAGAGRLPVLVAQGLRRAGHRVVIAGFAGQYERELRPLADQFAEVGVLRIGSWGRALRRMGARHAVLVGRVDKARLMYSWWLILRNMPDWRAWRMYLRQRRDRRSHVILTGLADELARDGVALIDSTAHITDHLAHLGVMTERRPTDAQQASIDHGWQILREMLRLDIGQAIAIRDRDVVAVEAVEGTDRMIARAGELCRSGGWCLLKAARAGHDRRSDVPTVGAATIRHMHAAGGRVLALAAGDVIIVDKPETLALADRLGVSVVGMPKA